MAMLVFALVSASLAVAQTPTTRLTLGGFTGNVGNTTQANFDAGFRQSGSATTYTVQITAANTIRTTGVYIRADAATMGGGKPVSDCQWRRNDLGTWNPLTTSDVLVESRVIQTNGTSWNNSIWFRCSLDWATDLPRAYSVGVTITLQVTP